MFCRDRDVDTAAFGVMIDGEGQVTDFIRLVNLVKSIRSWREVDREGKVNN